MRSRAPLRGLGSGLEESYRHTVFLSLLIINPGTGILDILFQVWHSTVTVSKCTWLAVFLREGTRAERRLASFPLLDVDCSGRCYYVVHDIRVRHHLEQATLTISSQLLIVL